MGLTEPPPERKSELCQECGECCKWISLDIVKPSEKEEDGVHDWFEARNIEVLDEDCDGHWKVKIPFPCPHLQENEGKFRCDIYETRPKPCAEFDGRMSSDTPWLDCKWEMYE